MASEEERVAALREVLGVPSEDVRVGIGDDAAVLADGVVLSVDAAVEGTHFRRDFGPLRRLARRAVVGALSDLAAMGASPRAILSSLVVPPAMDDAELIELHRGVADAAREVDTPVVGGNLAAGRELSLTTTVVGRAPRPLCRHGARPGDGVYVTGPVGDAGLGLRALLAGRPSPYVERWLRPRAHIAEGVALTSVATACVDVSDGLLRDLSHLCAASGVGAEIDVGAFPRGTDFDAEARALGEDPDELLLTSGEAYVLLFTAPVTPPVGARVGSVVEDEVIRVRDRAGRWSTRAPAGYDHFEATTRRRG